MQGETLISSNSGKRLVAGEGGEGDDSGTTRPRRFGKFSNINDLGLVGSGDIKLKKTQNSNFFTLLPNSKKGQSDLGWIFFKFRMASPSSKMFDSMLTYSC